VLSYLTESIEFWKVCPRNVRFCSRFRLLDTGKIAKSDGIVEVVCVVSCLCCWGGFCGTGDVVSSMEVVGRIVAVLACVLVKLVLKVAVFVVSVCVLISFAVSVVSAGVQELGVS
jgi:hypothetical protein